MKNLHFKSLIRGMLIGWIAAIAAVVLASCATTRPQPEPTPLVPPVVAQLSPDSLATLPPYLVPAPAGSSPAQRRQWQRAQARNLATAGALPRAVKVKNSSVATAPGATAVNRPAAAVATGPGSTATDNRKASRGGGGVATGPAATATGATEIKQGLPWWLWLVFGLGCCAVGWRVARGSWI